MNPDGARDLVVSVSSAETAAPGPTPRLATPLGLALVIPLLVLVSGLGITLLAWTTTRQSARTQAAATLIELGRSSHDRAVAILSGGGPVLDAMRMARLDRDGLDDRQIARILTAILHGREGLAVAHASFPDGRWIGVAQSGGSLRLLVRRPAADGTAAMSEQTVDDAGTPIGGERTIAQGFDPRQRPYWEAAIRAARRTWSEPYVFAGSGLPGISLAEPVTDERGLRLVIAVDFDLESLSAPLEGADARCWAVILAPDRAVLAMPAAWRNANGRMIRASDLVRPEAKAFSAALEAGQSGEAAAMLRYTDATGAEWGASVQPLRLPDGPTWLVARIAGRDLLLGDSASVLRHGLILACVVLGLAVATGTWFALHLARARRASDLHRDRARELGSYRLERRLGQGGMGEVWLARHRLLRRPAAVKLILPDRIAADQAARAAAHARFEREARITATLRCRSTIDLWDYGVAADGTWYYVMELLDGIEMRRLVQRHGPPPIGRTIHLLAQACDSLAEAHDHGLVHRDIRPENLFVCRMADEVDLLKVLDFGIVAEPLREGKAAITRAGHVNGTPAFMAPEQARGETLDGRTDLYALGCVAYWLACGHEVFEGQQYGVIAQHLSLQPQSPSERGGRSLPPEFESLILDCLAKSPGHRPPDARTLAARLRRIAVPAAEAWDPERARAWWAAEMPAPPT